MLLRPPDVSGFCPRELRSIRLSSSQAVWEKKCSVEEIHRKHISVSSDQLKAKIRVVTSRWKLNEVTKEPA